MMTRPATTDHTQNEAIALAASWLANTPRSEIEGPVIPAIQRRFPLNPAEAIEAERMAELIRRARAI